MFESGACTRSGMTMMMKPRSETLPPFLLGNLQMSHLQFPLWVLLGNPENHRHLSWQPAINQ